jgi:hypothetical protein
MCGIEGYDIPKDPILSSLDCMISENVFDHTSFWICIHIPIEILVILLAFSEEL